MTRTEYNSRGAIHVLSVVREHKLSHNLVSSSTNLHIDLSEFEVPALTQLVRHLSAIESAALAEIERHWNQYYHAGN